MDDTSEPRQIQLHKLGVRFGERWVLSQIDFEIQTGEIVALIGASGSGKSTLLRAIAGLIRPSAGSVTLGYGTELKSRRSGDLGYVFQDATLVPWRNVQRNIVLPLELGPSNSRRRSADQNLDALVLDALRDVELQPQVAEQFPHQLSGGMRMRVSLARALISDPTILLLDEPFGALDDLLRAKLHTLLLHLHCKRRRTIVFVTHNIDEAILLSDRVIVLGQSKDQPGQMREFLNPLPKPRGRSTRMEPDFNKAYAELSDLLESVSQ